MVTASRQSGTLDDQRRAGGTVADYIALDVEEEGVERELDSLVRARILEIDEKKACEEAKKEAIKIAVDKKRVEYVKAIERFMVEEKNARDFREQADKLKDLLGLTKEQIEQML